MTIGNLEHEIDILNRRVSVFVSESATKQNLANSTEDPIVLAASLAKENTSLQSLVREKDEALATFKQKVSSLEETVVEASVKVKEANQKLAAVEAVSHRDEHTERALDVLSQVQSLWREIGSSTEDEDDVLRSIENCLEDSCERKLNEVREKRDTMIVSIDATVHK
eukprot:scaffold34629_cov154-Amphora_coffeaeformis.AAC.1